MIKKRISQSFSKSFRTYQNKAIIQKQTATILSEMAEDLTGLGIDLGCGTGFLYESLRKKMIGVDISLKMLEIYKSKNPLAIAGDIEKLPFKNNVFDFAVSNFSLHWTDLKISLKEISKVLKQNGIFCFCMPIEGSLKIVENILGKRNYDFYSEKEAIEILSGYFEIIISFHKEFRLEFKNGLELLNHLHETGSAIGKEGLSLGEKKRIFEKFKNYNKTAVLNFNVLFVKALKRE